MDKSQRPNAGRSAYFRNRESLLAMTASAALLAGLTSASALPLNVAPAAPQVEAGRPVVKPNRQLVASREKSPAKAKANTDDVAAKANVLGFDGETALGPLRLAVWEDTFVSTYKVANYVLEPGVTCG